MLPEANVGFASSSSHKGICCPSAPDHPVGIAGAKGLGTWMGGDLWPPLSVMPVGMVPSQGGKVMPAASSGGDNHPLRDLGGC